MKEAILILGGSKSHIGFVRAAKKEGFRVIIVDKDPNVYCIKEADYFINSSILESDYILSKVKDFKIKGTLTYTSFYKGLKSAAIISKKLKTNLYSEKVVNHTTMKAVQKRILKKANIRIPKSITVSENNEQLDFCDLKFPVIIKPAEDSVGSKGVRKINDIKELNNYLDSNPGKYLVEEFIEGRLLQVAGFSYKGKTTMLEILDKFNRSDSFITKGFVMSKPTQDDLLINYWDVIENVFKRANEAIGIDNFFISTDMILSKRGLIYVIETGLLLDAKVDRLFDFAGFNVYEILINIVTGKEPTVTKPKKGTYELRFIFQDTEIKEDNLLIEGNLGDKPNSIADITGWLIRRKETR